MKTTKEDPKISAIIAEFKKQQKVYADKFKNGGKLIGLATGFDKLDNVIDGLRPEHFWIIGGYTNMGKTFAALNIAANLILQGKRVSIYSLEMSQLDIVARLLGIMTKQNGATILKAYPHDTTAVENAFVKMIESCLVVHTSKYDLRDIRVSMFLEHKEQPVDLFVLDFLQIVTVENSKSEYETTTAVAIQMQQQAKLLKVPIIALSQISNDGARNPDQDVMTFKGSGAIASAADLAIEITKYKGDSKEDWARRIKNNEPLNMTWYVRKNRHGKLGALDMEFDGRTGIFKPTEFEKL